MSSSPRDGLGERLAERVHENWANERRRQGWQPGPKRNDDLKQHPSLIPYDELSADEKKVDLAVSQGMLDALDELGLRVMPHNFDTFREYEFIAASTQFLTERRQAAAHTYLTVNTAIFGVIGFLIEKTSQTARIARAGERAAARSGRHLVSGVVARSPALSNADWVAL